MNNFENVYIQGIDIIEPDEFVTSGQIEEDLRVVYEKLKLPFGRIEMQTGVVSRGVYHDKLPSDIAIAAGKNLLAGKDPKDIDLMIYCGVCRDYLEPSTASSVHYHLGLRSDCMSFDLSNACLGVVHGMELAANLIEAGRFRRILLVTGENSKPLLSKTIDTLLSDESLTRKSIKKYFANFTIGSCGVAVMLGRDEGPAKLEKTLSLSNTSTYRLCQGSGDQNALVMETDSEALMQEGIKLARENWKPFSKKNEYQHFICHQVGIHHRNFLYENLGLDLDKDTSTFPRYGNTGSAALPLTFYKARDKFKSGDRIAFLGIGSGLHTMAMEVTWI